MEVIREVRAMQARAEQCCTEGRRVVLVPTMGALHEGHLALIREGLKHGDDLIVSIFVNPTQFGPGEDYGRYPRMAEEDLALVTSVDPNATIFLPEEREMYPSGTDGSLTWIGVDKLTEHLCGPYRPGHFRGVTTVVGMLFNICRPHSAVFGLKDAQQFVILKRMVSDLHYGVGLVGVPTVRHEDGLAQSSRNAYLNDGERRQARVLSDAVFAAQHHVIGGERRSEALVHAMRHILARAPDARVQYAEVVDAETLQPVEDLSPGTTVLAAVAVYFGATRLIDSAFIPVPGR